MLKDKLTKILYQNSTDDSECMHIKFEKVDTVLTKLSEQAVEHCAEEAVKFLRMRIDKLTKKVLANPGHRSNIETKARVRELELLLAMLDS